MLKGNLNEFALSDIFRLLSFTKKTGRLEVARSAGQGTVFFREGEVYYAESSLTREPLGQKLIRAGVLTESQLRKALDEHASTGRRIGEILVERGAVNRDDLEAAIRGQIEDAAFELLRWETGDFDFYVEGQVVAEIPISVSVENLVMEASRRLDEIEVIERKIPNSGVILEVAPAPPEGSHEINIRPEEWRVLVLVDGRRTVAQIADLAGLDEFVGMRTLYGLVSAGLVAPAAVPVPVAEEAPAEVAEVAEAPPAEAVSEAAEEVAEEASERVPDEVPQDEAPAEQSPSANGTAAMPSHVEVVAATRDDASEAESAEPSSEASTGSDEDATVENDTDEAERVVDTGFEPVMTNAPTADEPEQVVIPEASEISEMDIPQDETEDDTPAVPAAVDDFDDLIGEPDPAPVRPPSEEWFRDPDLDDDRPDQDSLIGDLLNDDAGSGPPVPPPAPAPANIDEPSPAAQPPAAPPRVDRAAVVRELASLFSDDEPTKKSRPAAPQKPAAVPPTPAAQSPAAQSPAAQSPAPPAPTPPPGPAGSEALEEGIEAGAPRSEAERHDLDQESGVPEGVRHTLDDDDIDKGLIHKLIDGVKGL